MAKKILIVEDDKHQLEILKDLLEQSFPDEEIIMADSGYEAIEKLRAGSDDFKIIISDLIMKPPRGMPWLNGDDLLKIVKADNRMSKVFFIIYSGTSDHDLMKRLGADRVVDKPEYKRLLSIIQECLLTPACAGTTV